MWKTYGHGDVARMNEVYSIVKPPDRRIDIVQFETDVVVGPPSCDWY